LHESIFIKKDNVTIGMVRYLKTNHNVLEANYIRFDKIRLTEAFWRGNICVQTQKGPFSINIVSNIIISSADNKVFHNLYFTDIKACTYKTKDFVFLGITGPLYIKNGIIRLKTNG